VSKYKSNNSSVAFQWHLNCHTVKFVIRFMLMHSHSTLHPVFLHLFTDITATHDSVVKCTGWAKYGPIITV